MALQVVNGFVDITDSSQAVISGYIAQHQNLFPGNVIAEWTIDGRRYFKVPHIPSETPPGLNVYTFCDLLLSDEVWDGGAPSAVSSDTVDGGSV